MSCLLDLEERGGQLNQSKRVWVCGFTLGGLVLSVCADFSAQEDLGYSVFIPTLRSPWKGVYATYLSSHTNDGSQNAGFNKNHEVSTESTSLLAHLAVLRGDQVTLDEMLDLWFSETHFYSAKFQLDHWLLDENGNPLGTDDRRNASGEEVRMLEVLKRAYDRFPSGQHAYHLAAQKLAEGLKGVNGGQGNFEAPSGAGPDAYLLRPWFVWSLEDQPLSTPLDPPRVPLNYNNYVAYHNAATWLGDPFFQQVINYTVPVVAGSQNTTPDSPGQGLFRLQYDMLLHQYFTEEEGKNESATLGACDIATRIGAYGHLVGNAGANAIGQRYLDFLKTRYRRDGVIWGSYDVDTGEPVPPVYAGFVLCTFAAKLAMEYGDFDLAEKLFREQVLPFLVVNPSDPGFSEGYRGAFKTPATRAESQTDLWKDAGAFANLETLIALHTWNSTDKGSWVSHAPRWTTVVSVRGGDGGEDRVSFSPLTTRYVRVLCQRRGTEFGYSLWSLNVFGSDGTDAAAGRPVSVSSAESENYTSWKAVDGNEGTRWSSAFQDPQWIYVDLGTETEIRAVRLNWEAAYAVDYEIQADPVFFIGLQPRDSVTQALADGLHFGDVSGVSNTVCPQYLEVSFANDATSWGVNVWTDYGGANVGGSPNRGGLHKNFDRDEPKVSLGWQAYDAPEDHGTAPLSETAAPMDLADPDWTFVKSRKDVDWGQAQTGYARILIGTSPDTAVLAGGPGAGQPVTSPVAVYFAAYFESENTPAGAYSATVGCDLYHE